MVVADVGERYLSVWSYGISFHHESRRRDGELTTRRYVKSKMRTRYHD